MSVVCRYSIFGNTLATLRNLRRCDEANGEIKIDSPFPCSPFSFDGALSLCFRQPLSFLNYSFDCTHYSPSLIYHKIDNLSSFLVDYVRQDYFEIMPNSDSFLSSLHRSSCRIRLPLSSRSGVFQSPLNFKKSRVHGCSRRKVQIQLPWNSKPGRFEILY